MCIVSVLVVMCNLKKKISLVSHGGEGLGFAAPGHPHLHLPRAGPTEIMRGMERVSAAWRRVTVDDPALWRRIGIDTGAFCFPPADGW